MGYSHYWSRGETAAGPLPSEPPVAYGRLALDTLAIISAAGVPLANGLAEPGSAPVVDEGWIWLNGAAADHGETFAWPARIGPEPMWATTPGYRWWDVCKTQRRPYDIVVTAILIRAGHHYGSSVEIESDGSWGGAKHDATTSSDWLPARRLIVDLFGPEADRCPFPSD